MYFPTYQNELSPNSGDFRLSGWHSSISQHFFRWVAEDRHSARFQLVCLTIIISFDIHLYKMSSEKKNLMESQALSEFEQQTRKIPPRLKLQKLPEKTKEDQNLHIFVVTWNLMGSLPPEDNVRQFLCTQQRKNCDVLVIGTQECQRSLFISFFCQSKQAWENMLSDILQEDYVRIGSEVLQGLHLIAFVKKNKYQHVNHLQTKKIKTGFCGLVGNKGGIQLMFSIGSKRFIFVNTHLQPYQQNSQKRSSDLLQIVEKLVDNQIADEVFVFGDFNYRISISLKEAQQCTNQQLMEFKDKDQLYNQQKLKDFISDYTEGNLNFLPTYKLHTNQNKYSKTRIPGWTDRIFYKSNDDIKQLSYNSDFTVFGSDHRPVYALFKTSFKKIKDQYVPIKITQSKCNIM